MPRRAVLALLGVGAGIALLFITWYLSFHVGVFARADQSILRGFFDLHRPRVAPVASFIAQLCNPKPYVFFAAVPVIVALRRGRPQVAIAIVAILFGANVTTELLKPVLAQPRVSPPLLGVPQIFAGSWPSGHATAAMTLALCSVLAAPARLRPIVAALGAVFAVAVSYSFLTLGWHLPSDVFGGFLVAATWTLLGVAAVFTANARTPVRTAGSRLSLREALGPPAIALVGALALVVLAAIAGPHEVVAWTRVHTAFMVGAAAIGALSLTLATGIMLALRR
ncbi:MAG TPA: phosphatase PAP2 family protein [Solirubrobacteraceae bacterium]|nr:phosphatase PAP2 family protein [Solirubrobacteraceae bacterium]